MQMVLPLDYGRRVSGVARSCVLQECSSRVYGHGYCSKHYHRWKRHGDPYFVKKAANNTYTGKSCAVEGCDASVKLLGYCNTHGLRFKRNGDPLVTTKVYSYGVDTTCLVADCATYPTAHGYCPTHWARVRSNGDPLVVQRVASWAGIKCKEQGCQSQAHSRGWCRPHYIQHNMAAFLEYGRKRRATKAAALCIPYTAEQLRQKLDYWGNRCWMCGGPAQTVDHVKPLSKGGADCLANFRPACTSCNSSKKDRWSGVRELRRFLKH